MSDFWKYGFLMHAIAAGVLLAVICGMLSPIIVLRRLSFAADGLAHASLGGLAIGLSLFSSGALPGVAEYLFAIVFTCGVAAAMAFFARRVQSDTAIGACYVAAFALGIALLSQRRHGVGHLEHIFFGSILAVQKVELVFLAILLVVTTAGVFATWRWLSAWVFDEDLARAEGVPVSALRYAIMFLVAIAVVSATRVVGVLLVAALLVLPGAAGCLMSRRLVRVLGTSTIAALASSAGGMVWSNSADIPPGAAIVLCLFAHFVGAYGFHRWREHRAAGQAAKTSAVRPQTENLEAFSK